MYGYIYKTTNTINNKIYIGQHKATTFNPAYKGSGKLLRKAFLKYGKENFNVEFLEACSTQEILDTRERFYIKLFNSTDIMIGYNLTYGGQAKFFTGLKHSAEAKLKMRDRALARNNHAPTTLGRIYMHLGDTNKCIEPEEIPYYLSIGYELGKAYSYKPAWNKGLKASEDIRVYNNQKARKAMLNEGIPIGCCGLSGDNNISRLKSKARIDSLDKSEVYAFWYENGKSATLKKYSAYNYTYDYLCFVCNIEENPEHTFYIRSKAHKINKSK